MKAMRFTGTFVLLAVVILGIGVAVAQDAPAENPYTCSPTSPCKIGCCGKNNVCGMGPDYCSAENCISTCNAKSDCDPGWGAQWSAHEKCPLNVCCSKFGFCGTTKDFCGDEKVKSPSCAISSKTASQKVIGYYEAWAPTRACNGMYPESLPIRGYTHLNFAFAFIDPNTYALAPMSEGDPALYKRFTGLKDAYPGLETWISVGGWTMNDPEQPTASTFSKLAASADAQSKFFKSLVNFMSTYGFDGVDIDWEYPVAPERSGQPADLANYVSFLRNLKNALGSGGHKYGLTLTLPSSFWYLQNFDIKAISNIVDWLNIMSYDLHGTWDSTSPWIGAIVNAHTNLTEIDQTLDLMWRNDIRPEKIVLGIGFYGRSFTLVDPSCTKAGCPFSEGGAPGACSASAGTLMYSEIETIVDEGGKLTIDKDSGSAIVTWGGNQWVSYDNTETLKSKMDFANGKCLGGVMVWAASTDDSKGTAIQALNKAAGRDYTNTLALAARSNEKISSCVWGACNENCESGYSPASSSSGKTGAFAGIFNGCPSGQERKYCCPTGNVPKCEWKGWGFCSPSCSSKQIEVTSSTSAEGTTCWTGHRILCCDKNEADKDIGQCRWSGSAPFCVWEGIFFNPLFFWDSASCPSDYHNKQTTGKYGAGGEQPCNYNSGWKSFCCNDNNPYASRNCKWRQGRDQIWSEWASSFLAFGILHNQLGQDCKGECVDGQVPIATDGTNCQSGTYSYYCCDNPNSPSLPAPGVVNRCPRASSFPSVNTDGQCPISLRTRSSDIVDREAYWRVNASIETTSLSLVSRGVIEKRAGQDLGEALVLCFGQARVDLFPQTYPGQTVLKNAGRSFIGVANLVGCGVVGLASYASAQIGETYVTEHVLEKQMVRDAIQAMLNGKDLVGNALTAGAVQFQGVFDATGIFINGQWNAAFGNNPMDSIFGALGHTSGPGILADITNLQIFDSKLNNMKALMIAGSNVISTTAWNAKGLMDKVAFLSDYIDMFNYFRYSGVPTSFQTTFRAVRALFNAFSTLVQNNLGITYDFGGAWEQIIRAQLTEVSRIARVNFIALLTQLTNDFNNPLLTALLMPNDITAGRAALTNFAANAGTLIALDNNALT